MNHTHRKQSGGLPYKKNRGCLSYLYGVKSAVLVPLDLGQFSLKRSTTRAFAVHLRALSQKIFDMIYVVLEVAPLWGETCVYT